MRLKRKALPTRTSVEKYGITDAYELEAPAPSDLVSILKDAREQVIDLDLFKQELKAERDDSAKLVAVRQQTGQFFKSLRLD